MTNRTKLKEAQGGILGAFFLCGHSNTDTRLEKKLKLKNCNVKDQRF
jgi:hypothetical protein